MGLQNLSILSKNHPSFSIIISQMSNWTIPQPNYSMRWFLTESHATSLLHRLLQSSWRIVAGHVATQLFCKQHTHTHTHHPIIYRVSYPSGWLAGFLPSTVGNWFSHNVDESSSPESPRVSATMNSNCSRSCTWSQISKECWNKIITQRVHKGNIHINQLDHFFG